jgi:glutamate-1-semialdehyde aminotransferase
MFLPELWPSYFSRAKGAEVWDLDGAHFIDMSYSGLGACVLGYAEDEVDAAAHRAIDGGGMCTLNCPEEVELAELLLELHPWAEMVRFARTGGEAMAVAVRLARAATGRDRIAFCGYHGWHDWYLAANLAAEDRLDGHLLPGLQPSGVPRGLLGTAVPFQYNDEAALDSAIGACGSDLAAIVMEPVRNFEPAPGFLETVRRRCTQAGAVLIFDEITSGWRLACGGAHLVYGVRPDVAVFAKGMSNGYPMAAIVGTAGPMQAAQTSFISSTYWTERIGPAATLASIRAFRSRNVARRLVDVGRAVRRIWEDAARRASIDIDACGIAPLGHFTFRYANAQAIRTLFTQLMLERGFLATSAFYAMAAHRDEHLAAYEAAVGEVFPILAEAIRRERVEQMLRGPVAHTGFRRLT